MIFDDRIYMVDFGEGRKLEIPGKNIMDILWVNYRMQFVLEKIDTNPIAIRNQGSL